MARTVVGVFDTGLAAKRAVEDLVQGGIPRDDISVVAGDPEEEYASYGRAAEAHEAGEGAGSAATGAAGGAVLGGVLGLLAGLVALPIPGIGPIIAAGPIVAALTGTAVGAGIGAAAGGLIGYLMDVGVPETEARYYSEAVRRGHTLVTVQATEPEAERVARILDDAGARDIEGMAEEWRRDGWTTDEAGSDAEAARARTAAVGSTEVAERRTTDDADLGAEPRPARAAGPTGASVEPASAGGPQQTIPVVHEELQVGTRPVRRGGVRVYSRVGEEPVEEQVRLREEHVRVDRRPVDRLIGAEEAGAFREASIEMTETAEEPVVAKRARVIEEVVVDRDVEERTETVRDTVRRTTVDVERLGEQPAGATAAYAGFESDFRRHCEATFRDRGISYEECAPAYRYGHTLGTDPRFGREWPAVEGDARRRWEERNPGTWERFKDSIRYAWDRARAEPRAAA